MSESETTCETCGKTLAWEYSMEHVGTAMCCGDVYFYFPDDWIEQ